MLLPATSLLEPDQRGKPIHVSVPLSLSLSLSRCVFCLFNIEHFIIYRWWFHEHDDQL